MNALRRLGDLSATPWYGVALMLGFLLNAWSFAPVHPLAVIRTFVLASVIVAAFTIVLGMALRNMRAGGFVAALLVGGLLGWARASTLVAGFLRQGLLLKIGLGLVVVAAALIAVWLFWRFVVVQPGGWARLTYGLNVVGAVFVAVATFGAIRSGALPAAAGDLFARPPAGLGSYDPTASPNIYLVLLDGYPRHDVVERVFDWDNTAFLDALRKRGFAIGVTNSSNYLVTPYTLMSMWHMRHVPDLPEMAATLRGEQDWQLANRHAVNRNEAFDLLRQHGYEIVTVAPPWEDVSVREADVYIDNGGINEFEQSLVQRTALGELARAIAPDVLFQQERDRVNFALKQLDTISAETGADRLQSAVRPHFVFVHVVIPHMPVVFGPGGEPVRTPYEQFFWVDSAPQRGMTRDEFLPLARGQIEYTSSAVIPALDALLANDPNAVVVLFGDHGSGAGMDWSDVPGSDLGERFGNLFAARTPGRSNVFDVNGTLINVFPALFGEYFGVDVPRQPDLHYAWRDGKETDLYLWEGNPG